MNQYIYVRPRDDGQGWAVDVYDGRRAWAKTHLGERPLNKAEAHRVILGEVPTEFFEGEWHFPKADGPEPWAVITYTDEPSPETGHVGWCWWAMGSMGDAPSYEAASHAAIAEIQRRMDDRMAVL